MVRSPAVELHPLKHRIRGTLLSRYIEIPPRPPLAKGGWGDFMLRCDPLGHGGKFEEDRPEFSIYGVVFFP
jgi:hypothetical protein